MCVCTYTHISKYILLLFGCLVMSDSLQSHGLQHARLPCSSPSPGALLKLMSTEVVTASNHLVLCHPLLLLPSIFPSIRVFPNNSGVCIRWPKNWSFSFSISPSNEYSGLDFFQRRQWHPTPVLLPGKSHGRRSLVGCSPWGRDESDMTERLHFDFSLSCTGEGNGSPLQCSCLENPRDGGARWAAVYGVA